eukprot:TRINITY_DN387_c0_g5_i2.p1 TRINITY_DN387_c0_g5~~TRINITY_DN387_c0_g5_i2.p1  ORF type:complete len:281 (-),score=50.61 TRINITY_DN387_c0_g5_i2:186-947(-)
MCIRDSLSATILSTRSQPETSERVRIEKDGQTVIFTPTYVTPQYTLIWLHGFGQDSTYFVPFFTDFFKVYEPNLRVVIPTAPLRFIKSKNNEVPAWFILGKTRPSYDELTQVISEEQVKESAGIVRRYINKAINYHNNNPHRVFIGGYSQGAVMSLYVGLTHQKTLAGVAGFSGLILPFAKETPAAQGIPILTYIAEDDEVIPFTTAIQSYSQLKASRHRVAEIFPKSGAHAFLPTHNVLLHRFLSDVINNEN